MSEPAARLQTVAIAGLGLIGGSFAMALRAAGFTGRLLGVSSPATTTEALRRGIIDEAVSLEQACQQADLLYLAQPINAILACLPTLTAWAKPGLLVTDAGSTKREIVAMAQQHLPDTLFLGGHPMAGKAERGLAAAEATLFQGRSYLLTPTDDCILASEPVKELQRWLRTMGASVLLLSPAEHDRVVATVSHLPQLVSTALTLAVRARIPEEMATHAAGPGLRDMARLAQSSYELWDSILATNRDEVLQCLDAFADTVQQMRLNLQHGSLQEAFVQAAELAERLHRKEG